MAPIFDFKAFSTDGKAQKGIIEAETSKVARQKLKKQGLMVTEITEKSVSKPSAARAIPFFGGKVPANEVALMTRQLASLVKANIPLVEALNALVEQTEIEVLKVVLEKVRQDVNEGSSLAKALALHPKIFDNIFVNMVEAGESSGTLSQVLLRLADLKEAQMRLRGKIVAGTTYPMLMMGLAVVMMIGIFTFLIPKLTKIFESMNKPLPPITKALLSFSGFITDWWFLILFVTVVGGIFFRNYTNSELGRPKWDAFKLRSPVFGKLIRMIAMTRFASTMGTLLESGVPILTAMNIAKNLVGNAPISNAINRARENITEGQSIAEPLRRSGEFFPVVIHMISIGEKTGELPSMLKSIADTYEDQVKVEIEKMTAKIEPIMIVGMGIVVAFIVFAVFIPMMDISAIQ
ncbi:MAG: type II secretion system inner membrane protein GspF [Bdellovibrionales bacterium]|nr:type II secretion system inner membrane protein GspF [Bdellovibrionales bacterium]